MKKTKSSKKIVLKITMSMTILLRPDSLLNDMSASDSPWPLYQGLGRGGSCKLLLEDKGVK